MQFIIPPSIGGVKRLLSPTDTWNLRSFGLVCRSDWKDPPPNILLSLTKKRPFPPPVAPKYLLSVVPVNLLSIVPVLPKSSAPANLLFVTPLPVVPLFPPDVVPKLPLAPLLKVPLEPDELPKLLKPTPPDAPELTRPPETLESEPPLIVPKFVLCPPDDWKFDPLPPNNPDPVFPKVPPAPKRPAPVAPILKLFLSLTVFPLPEPVFHILLLPNPELSTKPPPELLPKLLPPPLLEPPPRLFPDPPNLSFWLMSLENVIGLNCDDPPTLLFVPLIVPWNLGLLPGLIIPVWPALPGPASNGFEPPEKIPGPELLESEPPLIIILPGEILFH